MTSRSPDGGESERDRDRDRERELGMASSSSDSGECERGRDRERERRMTSSSPDGIPPYWNVSYWDERYRNNNNSFDWYMKYTSLAPLFDLYLHRHHRVLIVGCGNSALGEDMADDGYEDIVNIDISSVLIETMHAKYADKLALKYIKMDARDMSPFESGSFDAVIDKGTLDTFLCGENNITDATQMLKEVERVLKDKGAYILITFDDPNHRLELLKRIELWNIKLHVLDRTAKSSEQKNWKLSAPLPLDQDSSWLTGVLVTELDVFYIYVCIKDESLSANRATDTETPSSQNDT